MSNIICEMHVYRRAFHINKPLGADGSININSCFLCLKLPKSDGWNFF